MINLNIEKDIIKYNNDHVIKWKLLKNDWQEYLLHRWVDCTNVKESFFRILYNIQEKPLCKVCGKPAKFYGMKNYIYSETCGCKECSKINRHNGLINMPNDKKQKIKEKIEKTCLKKYGVKHYSNPNKTKQTCLKRYGVSNGAKTSKAKEKYKQTCLKKYGVENFYQSNDFKEKSKQTCLEKYGNEYYTNREKAKQTCLEKYGNENYSNQDKAKQTKLERYGNLNNYQQIEKTNQLKYGYNSNLERPEIQEKIKQTNLERYGVDNPSKSNIIKEKTKRTNLRLYGGNAPVCSKNVQNKIKQTCLEKYGVSSYFMTDECIKKSHNDESKQKIYQTKRKNHTFNTSKIEIDTYNLLKEKYPDVIYQYKDKQRYPFMCDFYIPSLDLFIECNYHWTHGGIPYEGTINDNKKLQEWKDKNTKYYNNAIITWIVRDVNKRNIAKQNKLNWIEFFNLEELKKELLK